MKRKGFFSNTLQLMFGNIGAQAINFLTIPILTRIYSPESYGLLIIFLAVSMFFISISSLRLNVAILLPKEEEDAINILLICLLILFIISLLTLLIGFLVFSINFRILEAYHDLGNYVVFFTAYVFFQGALLIFNTWHVRRNQFKILSITNISQIASDKCFVITLGMILGDNPLWLVLGAIIGSIIPTGILFFKGIATELKMAMRNLSLSTILISIKRYKSFLIYSPINLLETFSREITPVFFGLFFGVKIVGFFGLASRIIRRPLNIFGDAISRSFFHELATTKRNNQPYSEKVNDLFYYLLLLGIVPVIIFSLVAPEFIGLIFGKEWASSGIYVGILALPFFSSFLYRPLSIIFEVQERQGLRFSITLIKVLIIPLVIYFGGKSGDPIMTVIIYSGTVFSIDFFFSFFLLKLALVDLSQMFKHTFIIFGMVLIATFPVILAKNQLSPESPLLLIGCASIIMVIYFTCVALFDKRINFFFSRSLGLNKR